MSKINSSDFAAAYELLHLWNDAYEEPVTLASVQESDLPQIVCLCCGQSIKPTRTDMSRYADNYVLKSQCCGKVEHLHISKHADLKRIPKQWVAFLSGAGDPKIS